MKIKVEKEMKLPQLIEWAWENNVNDKVFYGSLGGKVEFSSYTHLFTLRVESTETFTVEVEEEITEEYKLPEGLAMYKNDNDDLQNIQLAKLSINDAKKYVDELDGKLEALYMVNSSTDLVLIWKDGEMVE
ncbi:hypothetical protein PCV68_001013 [Staphylococcus pseudintermedius]|nr:hypothetical protein [Staphylococcus pseudintermedius]